MFIKKNPLDQNSIYLISIFFACISIIFILYIILLLIGFLFVNNLKINQLSNFKAYKVIYYQLLPKLPHSTIYLFEMIRNLVVICLVIILGNKICFKASFVILFSLSVISI